MTMDHPEAKKLRWIALVIQTGVGFTNGLLLSVLGPFFYDRISASAGVAIALTVTMVLFAFRQSLVALLEIPTGALADTIGRARVVVLSLILLAAMFMSLAAMVFCHSVTSTVFWASTSSICYAVYYSLFNGSFSAWAADSLQEKAPNIPYAWLASRFSYYQAVGSVVGCLISIVLYIKQLPFVAFSLGAICTYIMMGFAISQMREPLVMSKTLGKRRPPEEVLKDMGQRISNSFSVVKKRPVIMWMVMLYGSYMFLVNLVSYLWPVYLRASEGIAEIGRNWVLTAMITEMLYFSGARLFVFVNDWLTKNNRGSTVRFATYRKAITLTALSSAGSVIFLSYMAYYGDVSTAILIAVVGVVLFCAGWIISCFDILVNSFIPVDRAQDRSTIISSGSMFRSLFAIILSIPAGGVSAKESPVGWSIPAVLLFISAAVSFFLLKSEEKRRVSVKSMEVISAPS